MKKLLILFVLFSCLLVAAQTSPYINAIDYGLSANAQKVSDCTVTANNTALTCSSSHFTSGDVGKLIAVPYAGPNNGVASVTQTFVTTIAGFTSGTSITLAAPPNTSIPGPRTIADGAGSSNSFTVTSATASFVVGDVGKQISLPGAGVGAGDQTSLITGINSSTSIGVSRQNLATVSAKTISIPGATVIWGQDDSSGLQSAINAGCAGKIGVILPAGNFLTTVALVPCSNLTLIGMGSGKSIIYPIGTGFAAFQYNGGSVTSAALTDVQLSNFEIDASGVRANTYSTGNKAIFIRPMIRPIVQNLYIHDCSATCIGIDYIQNGQIVNNTVRYGGVQVGQFGSGAGGACIGIGTGLWLEEPDNISGNHVSDCGQHGIFVESQSSTILSRGIRITNNDVRWVGFGLTTSDGIGDHATQGTIIADNTVEYCSYGIEVSNGFVNSLYSADWMVTNNYVANAKNADILVNNKSGGGRISDNVLVGYIGTSALMDLNAITGGTQGTFLISGNKLRDVSGRCIWLHAGAFGPINIANNDISNCGVSGTERAGISFEATSATALNLQNNTVYDTRGTPTTSFGFQLVSGTITRLWMSPDNDFLRVLTAGSSLTGGTVTTQLP